MLNDTNVCFKGRVLTIGESGDVMLGQSGREGHPGLNNSINTSINTRTTPSHLGPSLFVTRYICRLLQNNHGATFGRLIAGSWVSVFSLPRQVLICRILNFFTMIPSDEPDFAQNWPLATRITQLIRLYSWTKIYCRNDRLCHRSLVISVVSQSAAYIELPCPEHAQ